jgi:Uma2 family endonuclease
MELPRPITVSEFLSWRETQTDAAYELINGRVVRRSTPTRLHAALVRRLRNKIELALDDDCDIYAGDITVEIENAIYHSAPAPDIAVTCDDRDRRPEDLRSQTIRYPKLVVEVLSQTTAEIDLGTKVYAYFCIPTLVEYLIVDSRKRYVVLHQRKDGAVVQSWPDKHIDLISVFARITVAELYGGLIDSPTVPLLNPTID